MLDCLKKIEMELRHAIVQQSFETGQRIEVQVFARHELAFVKTHAIVQQLSLIHISFGRWSCG